ncbi:MAG: DUF4942 domain-containing protein [Paludibacteraceae bacterium]|nr:DUF4942 domain-containing protein [Paludibacteraceae bacterium]
MENNIFDRDFYPTPQGVIDSMLAYSDVTNKVVLEPSAGSGNIVEWLNAHSAKNVLACETNEKLKAILSTKKCDIIASDFLTVTPEQISHIDMIVMNPPFTADEKHILHAFEVAPDGCEIIALCNTNTLDKGSIYTDRRKLRELVDKYGSDEYFGECFGQSEERRTRADISCVRLFKPKQGRMEFDDYFSMEDDEKEPQADGLITYDFVKDAVSRYCDAVKRFDSVMEQNNAINELTKGIGGDDIKFGTYRPSSNNNLSNKISREYFKKELQKSAWKWLFDKFDMEKYITRGVMSDINRFVEQQQNVPFTIKNIYRMVQMIVGTHSERMEKVLVEAFDKICSFSYENSTAGEKWKTNSDYMINKRFIIPYICDYGRIWKEDYVTLHYSYNNEIDDIIKALCYLTGSDYNKEQDLYNFIRAIRPKWGEWTYWSFFKIRGYKKGTMHFEFQNEETWMAFNREVARIKGWQLPKSRKGNKEENVENSPKLKF